MRKLTCLALILCMNHVATAQTKLAIRAGFNYSTARASTNSIKKSTAFVPGANIAIQLKTAFDGPLHFSPYIAYSTRGFIIKEDNAAGDKVQAFIQYFDIAPVLSLDFPTGANNSFSVAAGPLAGLALAGTEKTTLNSTTTSRKIKFSTEKGYGLFDLGLHTSVSFRFNKLFVELAYQYGFANINNEQSDKKNIRNRTFSLNLGYYFRSYK